MKEYEKSEFGSRMKTYENATKPFLTLGVPKVIRVDMRAARTYTRDIIKPFDQVFSQAMIETAKQICKQIPGAKFAYTQSDEISIALNDSYVIDGIDKFFCFFDGNLEKIVSLTGSIATLEFNKAWRNIVEGLDKAYSYEQISEIIQCEDPRIVSNTCTKMKIYKSKFDTAMFDSRVTVLPNIMELHNYFVWRQQDATRNSILSLARANYSAKEMDNKNCSELQDMLMLEKNINWNDLKVRFKRGSIICKEVYEKEINDAKCMRHHWIELDEIPIFTQDMNFIPHLFIAKTWN